MGARRPDHNSREFNPAMQEQADGRQFAGIIRGLNGPDRVSPYRARIGPAAFQRAAQTPR